MFLSCLQSPRFHYFRLRPVQRRMETDSTPTSLIGYHVQFSRDQRHFVDLDEMIQPCYHVLLFFQFRFRFSSGKKGFIQLSLVCIARLSVVFSSFFQDYSCTSIIICLVQILGRNAVRIVSWLCSMSYGSAFLPFSDIFWEEGFYLCISS